MAQYECIICGLIYDEAKGWPDDEIAPGTKWEDIPNDWYCPDCGVGKEDFTLLSEKEVAHIADAGKDPIVIVGTGLAAYNLAKEIRKLDETTPLILITKDDGASYSKPMLSTGFTKDKTAESLIMADSGKMAIQLNASIWTHTAVTHIDAQAKTICINEMKTVPYNKLVLACGADMIKPPLSGNALDRVYGVNSLQDYAQFRQVLSENANFKKIAIIGGGLIGSEFTNDLLNGDYQIEMIEAVDRCLSTLLPEESSAALQQAFETAGVNLHFNCFAQSVDWNSQGQVNVSLSDNSAVTADLVLSAIGVRPRIDLATKSNLECNRGIVANRLLETSEKDIYTLGDCAEVDGHVLFYLAPLMQCARALAKTLTGEPTEVFYDAMPVAIKTPICPIIVSPPAREASGQWSISGESPDLMAEYKNDQGDLLGFALLGTTISEKARLQKLLPSIM